MSENNSTFKSDILTYTSEEPKTFEVIEKVFDTSIPPQELYPPTKREYYFSVNTPKSMIYSISDMLLEQIEIFELNKRGL